MVGKDHNSATTGGRKRGPGVKLTRHSKGWVAKIGGKVKWLAPLDKPQLAMERYHQKMKAHLDNLAAPAVVADNTVSLGHVGQLFLDAKFAKVRSGELDPRTYDGYDKGVQRAVDHFGYDAVALNIPAQRWQEYRAELAKGDVYTLTRHVGAIRSLSKWAAANEYIDREFRFGTEFNRPSQKAIRAAKRGAGDRTYTPEQVRKILGGATPVLKAMFLLSINGGVGNTDIAKLTDANVKGDRIEFARSKTEVARVIPLWPETVRAIKAARAARPKAATPGLDAHVFLTERGHPYVRNNFDEEGNLTSTTDKIATLFWTELKALDIPRSFYDGRRTFQTIGDEVGPPHVVRAIMGHSARGDDMSSVYRQAIPMAQMWKVVNHVRGRLNVARCFGSASAKTGKGGGRRRATGRPAATGGKPARRRGRTAR